MAAAASNGGRSIVGIHAARAAHEYSIYIHVGTCYIFEFFYVRYCIVVVVRVVELYIYTCRYMLYIRFFLRASLYSGSGKSGRILQRGAFYISL
jgi:hypothetical protein